MPHCVKKQGLHLISRFDSQMPVNVFPFTTFANTSLDVPDIIGFMNKSASVLVSIPYRYGTTYYLNNHQT